MQSNQVNVLLTSSDLRRWKRRCRQYPGRQSEIDPSADRWMCTTFLTAAVTKPRSTGILQVSWSNGARCGCGVPYFLWYYDVMFKNFLLDTCPFVGPLIPLFWTSGDVSSGFQSQSGFCLIWTLWRCTWYTFPEIHLWCDTSAGV